DRERAARNRRAPRTGRTPRNQIPVCGEAQAMPRVSSLDPEKFKKIAARWRRWLAALVSRGSYAEGRTGKAPPSDPLPASAAEAPPRKGITGRPRKKRKAGRDLTRSPDRP